MKSPPSAVRRILLCLALPTLIHAQTRYVITNLGGLGGNDTRATAINASGVIVGYNATSTQASQAFIFSNGVISALPSLNTGRNEAYGVNASGTVAATLTTFGAGGDFRGFIVSGGATTDLGPNTTAVGINDAGTVVGNTFPRGFVRSSSGVVTLIGPATASTTVATAINASGVVVGYTDNPTRRAFSYNNGVLTNLGALPGGNNSYANAINAAGVVVGSSNEATNRQLHAVIFSGGNVTDIEPNGAGIFGGAALGINSSGVVVGNTAAGLAFVYTPATGLVELNSVVTNLAAAGFTSLTYAYAINDSGQIVGFGPLAGGGLRFGAFRLDVSTVPAAPTITANPQPHTVPAGAGVVFSVTATSTGLNYQWFFNNAAISGETSATLSLSSVSAGNAGDYSVRVSNEGGNVTSASAKLTVNSSASSRLTNLSILTALSGGSDSFTLGYVVVGTAPKPLVIRAVGPSLAQFSVSSPLVDPKFDLYVGQTRTDGNDNWGGSVSLKNAMIAAGGFDFNGPTSRDAALAVNVPPDSNTIIVSSTDGGSGTVIAEVYDATPPSAFTETTSRLINVSVLKNLNGGLTAGFTISGNASKSVLIRAVGPGLAGVGVPSGFLPDPQLALFSGQTKIGENNDWGGTAALVKAFGQVGAFTIPPASKDAAIVTTLAPGGYTVQVSATPGTNGLVIIEVYALP